MNKEKILKREEREKEQKEEVKQLQKLVFELKSQNEQLAKTVHTLVDANETLKLDIDKLSTQLNDVLKSKHIAEINLIELRNELKSAQFHHMSLSDLNFLYFTGLDIKGCFS